MKKHFCDDQHRELHAWTANRPAKHRYLILRFLSFFIPLLIFFNMAFYFINGLFYRQAPPGSPQPENWLTLPNIPFFVLAIVFFLLGALAFRRFSSPVAEMMSALDAVANGDLSVRVNEHARGEFRRMARSFNRMVQELDQAETNRRNLTADVAHELRTPLHIIQGNLEGMLDGVYELTPEQINATLDETRLLARLVNDLQTLSLAEAGKLHLHPEKVSMIDLIEDTITGFNGLAGEHGINLKSAITGSETELTISADADRLSQVLNNLVGNAIRYTPPGGTITLGAESIQGGVRMMVEDTGQGIVAEDLPYVFDRFWKAEQSRSRHEGTGSGLGLAIARQLVQAHGGTISVESRPGQGTKFVIDLPSVERAGSN
ncbi:MAG: HAMP domain-containing protein [Leptolinea sp.]|jgi:signal transduction histidine kinase|nr:HAMP domain-containing protein [Leptolinea sp.]